MAGKGDKMRPVNIDKFLKNWEEINWKKDDKQGKKLPNGKTRYVYGAVVPETPIEIMNRVAAQAAADDCFREGDKLFIEAICKIANEKENKDLKSSGFCSLSEDPQGWVKEKNESN